jgi:hypothetical protein
MKLFTSLALATAAVLCAAHVSAQLNELHDTANLPFHQRLRQSRFADLSGWLAAYGPPMPPHMGNGMQRIETRYRWSDNGSYI